MHLSKVLPMFAAAAGSVRSRRRIIIDTDIFSDVDDVGALAIANAFHNLGYVDLEGVAVNTHSKYGAWAASVVNTYFDNGDIPLAALRPLTDETFVDTWNYTLGEYASKVAYNFPRQLHDDDEIDTPLSLYQSLLHSSPNGSMTLISLGFLTNLADLLESPAHSDSPLSGRDLITARVRELVVMGGHYPHGGREYNFAGGDPTATRTVINGWPAAVPMTFVGYELGKDILSGGRLPQLASRESPVLAAYQWYVGRCKTARESWDPLAVLYGALGLGKSTVTVTEGSGGHGPLFVYGNENGYNHISENGTNTWVDDAGVTSQHWLEIGSGWDSGSISELLDRLLSLGPNDRVEREGGKDEL